MKKLSILAILIFIGFAGMAQETKTVTIVGKVDGDTKSYNNIYYMIKGNQKDSAEILNGQFNITLTFTGTTSLSLYTQYEIKNGRLYRPFPLFICDPGQVNISLNIEKGFFYATVKGPPTTVLYNEFLKKQEDIYQIIRGELTKMFGRQMPGENDPLFKKLITTRDSLSDFYMDSMIIDFVKQNKDSFVGIYVLSGAGKTSLNVEQLENLIGILPLNMKQSPEGEMLAAYIRGVKHSTLGKSVKNFVLNDQNGKPVSFDQFKGKYLWIDFWASWCSPCKQAFPHMQEIYAKYKDKNFEILGISTDAKIDPWLKILGTIKNPWPQVWDNKNIMSEFAVTGFPTSFLISPEGKILIKEIGYEPNKKGEIEQKLIELFD